MSRSQKTCLVAALIFLVYLAIVVAVAYLVPGLSTSRLVFIAVLALVGLIATIAGVIYKQKAIDPNAPPDANQLDSTNLGALVHSAELRMKQGKGAARSLGAMPLVYILGDENSGKTQTVLQSGLDAELLAGQVNRDGVVPPTQLANIWYTTSAAIVEAGGTLLRQPGLWYRLISLTAPGKIGAAFSKGALQPTRAAVVCVSTERILAAISQEEVRALGRALNEQLRLLSKALGITLPVYVLFTKLDSIPSFADFVTTLTNEEIRDPLGSLLAQSATGAGLYAEAATAQIAQRFDELCYSLSEYRLEVLRRGGESAVLARAYEFPRELRKLRSNIVDLLVETGRPSQLGINPFLRGFYFTGLRARILEEHLNPVSAPAPSSPPADTGATRVFTFNAAPASAIPSVARTGTRRVPQWVFLAHLFPRVFLADRGALDTSRASARVNVVKRILIGSVAACVFFYLVALTVSYLRNAALEDRLRAASALPMQSVVHGDPASASDLEGLESLRAVFEEITGYKKDGAPLTLRWGLYPGDRLYQTACSSYGLHLRTLLLNPVQSAILGRLAALQIASPPSGEYSAAYRPLRAYLISTAFPGYSTPDFEPAALQEEWASGRSITPGASDLALAQFRTYSTNIAEPGSCLAALGGDPQAAAVAHAQQYLSQFQGSEQMYLSMKTAANRKNPGLRFDDRFPQARPYVTDPYLVEGAFIRGGYDFMMDAIAHPEKYASGEEWVLGKQTGPVVPIATLIAPIPDRYRAEFLNAWRTYLKQARVVRAASFLEAYGKINQLSGNQSALLQLFQLLSQNTGVPNAALTQPFQAPQALVPPPATALPVGGTYTTILASLGNALNIYNNTPNSQHDPAATAGLGTASITAENAVNALSAAFTPDPDAHLDATTRDLLLAPIRPVKDLVQGAIKGGGDAPAQAFCAQALPLLAKFPFNPDGTSDASPEEVAVIFQPVTGAFARLVAAEAATVTLQGGVFVGVPGTPVNAGRGFLRFLSAAQQLSTAFFPLGGGPPSVTFSLTQEGSPGLPPATLDIDGTKLSEPGQTKQFTWKSSPASVVTVTSGSNAVPSTGTWSLFHFAYNKRSGPGRIEYIFQANDRPIPAPGSGVPLDYKFDVSGPAATLLNPGFMRNSLHCVTKVSQ